MASLSSPAHPSINQFTRSSKPKLSEISVHHTFIPPNPSSRNYIQPFIDKYIAIIDQARLVNTRIEESVFNSLRVLRRIHQLPPWIRFEGSKDVSVVYKTLVCILTEFATNLGISPSFPVSVSTAHAHGAVAHNELVHCIPRPCMPDWSVAQQSESAEMPHMSAVPCNGSEAKISQLLPIGFQSSGLKPCSRQSPISAQIPTLYSTPDDSEAKIQSPLVQRIYEKIRNLTVFNKAVPAQVTNSDEIPQEVAEAGGTRLYSQSIHSKDDEKSASQVQVDRQDAEPEKKSYQYSFKDENSGSIFEWPWVQTELPGSFKRSLVQSFRQCSAKEASPNLNMEESTAINLEPGSTHLRGGCAAWRNMHASEAPRRRTRRNKRRRHRRRNNIDLGYGGSHFLAEQFPEYDPVVDLMYLHDFDRENMQEMIHEVMSMETKPIEDLESALRIEPRCIRRNWSSAKFDLQPGTESTRLYLRGGMSQPGEYTPSKAPSASPERIRKRDRFHCMINNSIKFMRRKSPGKKQAQNAGSWENFEHTEKSLDGASDEYDEYDEKDGEEDGEDSEHGEEGGEEDSEEYEIEWPGLIPLQYDKASTCLERAIDYYNQHGQEAWTLESKLCRIKTRLAIAGTMVEEYHDYFEDTQELGRYQMKVNTLLNLYQEGVLSSKLLFECGMAAVGAKTILEKRINHAKIAESKFPAIRQPRRCRESKHDKFLIIESNELGDDKTDLEEVENGDEDDEWSDGDDDEKDAEILWRGKLEMWREADVYPLASRKYHQLRKQIRGLKATLCQIEERLPKNSSTIKDYRGISQDTEKLLDFELREIVFRRGLQKGTLTRQGRLWLMYFVCKDATRAMKVLKKRINLARHAIVYKHEVKRAKRKRNIFHFSKIKHKRYEKAHSIHSVDLTEGDDSSSDITIEKVIEEYDQLENEIRRLRLGGELPVDGVADLERNPNAWKILEEQHETEMLMRDIKYLRDMGRTPSSMLARFGILKAKQAKALIENNFDIAKLLYSRLKLCSIRQRGGAGNERKRDRLRWKLDNLTSSLRNKVSRLRGRSEVHDVHEVLESNEEAQQLGMSGERRERTRLSCSLTNYDRLSLEVVELHREERQLQQQNGAKIDEHRGYWLAMGRVQGHFEYRAKIQARRERGALLYSSEIERGILKAEFAKEFLELKNGALRDVSDDKREKPSGRVRGGGLERKRDLLRWKFVRAMQCSRGDYALKLPIAKEIFTSAKDTNKSSMGEITAILPPQSESNNTKLRGGAGPDIIKFCKDKLNKFRRRGSKSEGNSDPEITQRENGEGSLAAPTPSSTQTEQVQSQRQAHQQHSRGDSGVSGLDVAPSQPTEKSGQKDHPQQANVSSQPPPSLQAPEEDADVGHLKLIGPEDVYDLDPEESEERDRIELEEITRRQAERRLQLDEIPDNFAIILDEFIELEHVIRRRRNLLFCKNFNIVYFETKITKDDAACINEYKWGMLIMITLAKNCLIAARRTLQIFETWFHVMKDPKKGNEKWQPNLNETRHAAGILDNWGGQAPLIRFSSPAQRGESSSESTSSPRQHHQREESEESSSSSVPDLVEHPQVEEREESSSRGVPHPAQQRQGEERGESSRHSAPNLVEYYHIEDRGESSSSSPPNLAQQSQGEERGGPSRHSAPNLTQRHQVDELGGPSGHNVPATIKEIMQETRKLRIKNNLPYPLPKRKNIPFTPGTLFKCFEEDAIPEEIVNHFLEMGHGQEEVVFALSLSGGDPQAAAHILSPEGFVELQIPAESIDQLLGLGASHDEIVEALRSSNGSVELAAQSLFAEGIDVYEQPFSLQDVHSLADSLQGPASQAFKALVATGGDDETAALLILSGDIEKEEPVSLGHMHHLVGMGATGKQAYGLLEASGGDLQGAIGLFLEEERMGQTSFPADAINQLVAFGASAVAAGNALAIAGGDVEQATEILLPLITRGNDQESHDHDSSDGNQESSSEDDIPAEDVDRLVELGISDYEARDALMAFQGDVERAAESVLSHLSRNEVAEDGERQDDEMENVVTEDGERRDDEMESDETIHERIVYRNNTTERKGKGRAL
ncbi:hypothetical protein DSL72_005942 [Monilinia vaccinii-corymbosi]|uniref:UBA domain-containing protein n=1 Tax=Monilinia vaccinii-corymbosi TaxID=61207 RepID=A0A8A3PH79_9HELO|nr:hypothetical protein DSL72_005942 [Monilinia vaccinii-corymbosi]